MTIEIIQSPELTGLTIGVVEFTGVSVFPSPDTLRAWSDEVARRAAQDSELPHNEELRKHVRQMLRYGAFKASGRSKPAQEYLLRCAVENGSLPNINAPVDILNAVSLECGLPISLLSITKSSPKLSVRRGHAGESYVFNSVGQELNVADLIVVCDRGQTPERPIGSPIKDSMAGKIEASDDHQVAIIYAPTIASERLNQAAQSLIERFETYGVGRGRLVT